MTNKTEWILCPICNSKTRNKIIDDTVLKNYDDKEEMICLYLQQTYATSQ